MSIRRSIRILAAAAALSAAYLPCPAPADDALVPAGAGGTAGAAQYRPVAGMTPLTQAAKLALLRQRVKYVFILFQENRSFDHYFATYPGADGLFAHGRLIAAPGTTQLIRNIDGSYGTIRPFLIPRAIIDRHGAGVPLFPEDTATVDHSHKGILRSYHITQATLAAHVAANMVALNDGFALDEERLSFADDAATPADVVDNATGAAPTATPSLMQKQMAELVLAHLDCDTIPFLWRYADRFTLFDNFRMTAIGPSTPNAIAMIAGQVGDTQWALHPEQGDARHLTVPILADHGPAAGSDADRTPAKPPYGRDAHAARPTRNLTFATLPLSFAGSRIAEMIAADPDPTADLLDVQHDIRAIAAGNPFVEWGWYQQGFAQEPFDGTTTPDGVSHAGLHSSYIVHHNGPQYFGYLGDNPRMRAMLHGLQDFYDAVASRTLPERGGVFYVRGGFYNNDALVTADSDPAVRANFAGDDDHPAYSDAQISEANIADSVNAIAHSPYWNDSAIIITYDETDGLYDHVLPRFRTIGPDGMPETGASRIPAIVISPFAAAHTVSHTYSEHSSVIRFINALFGLTPLAQLPDELRGRALGAAQAATFHQPDLGPADALTAPMGDLTEAFDNDRLTGRAAPLPADYAAIPVATVRTLPHEGGAGCRALGIVPTDYVNGAPVDPPPQDFNPRPGLNPGTPFEGNWPQN